MQPQRWTNVTRQNISSTATPNEHKYPHTIQQPLINNNLARNPVKSLQAEDDDDIDAPWEPDDDIDAPWEPDEEWITVNYRKWNTGAGKQAEERPAQAVESPAQTKNRSTFGGSYRLYKEYRFICCRCQTINRAIPPSKYVLEVSKKCITADGVIYLGPAVGSAQNPLDVEKKTHEMQESVIISKPGEDVVTMAVTSKAPPAPGDLAENIPRPVVFLKNWKCNCPPPCHSNHQQQCPWEPHINCPSCTFQTRVVVQIEYPGEDSQNHESPPKYFLGRWMTEANVDADGLEERILVKKNLPRPRKMPVIEIDSSGETPIAWPQETWVTESELSRERTVAAIIPESVSRDRAT